MRKLQIYLASNYEVNGRDRYDAERELMRLGHFVSGVPCREDIDYDWDLARKLIDDCDFFVCLLGDLYGPMSPNGLSHLHREFVHAQSQGKPVLSFIKNTLVAGPRNDDQRRLAGFHQVVSKHNYRLWHLRDELVSHVKMSLPGLISALPGGWQAAEPEKASSSIVDSIKRKLPSAGRSASQSFKKTVRLQMSAKVYQAGNNQLKEVIITERGDRVFAWLAPMLEQQCAEDHLRTEVERNVAEEVEQKLLHSNSEAHAVDDIRINRVQFHRMLEEWVSAGLVEHDKDGHSSMCQLTAAGRQKITVT